MRQKTHYDITNILEGLGLLRKWSVSSAKWVGGNIDQYVSSDSEEKENLNNSSNYSDERNVSKE